LAPRTSSVGTGVLAAEAPGTEKTASKSAKQISPAAHESTALAEGITENTTSEQTDDFPPRTSEIGFAVLVPEASGSEKIESWHQK